MRSLTVAYAVLFLGFFMSLAILTVENCMKRVKNRRKGAITAPLMPIMNKIPIQAWVDASTTKVVGHRTALSKRWKFLMSTKNFARKVRAVSWRKTRAFFSSVSFDETDDDFIEYPATIIIESKKQIPNVISSSDKCH